MKMGGEEGWQAGGRQSLALALFCFFVGRCFLDHSVSSCPLGNSWNSVFCLPRNSLKFDCEILSVGHSLMVHLLQALALAPLLFLLSGWP